MATDTRPTILIQLDSDSQSSVFDGVVAVDAGINFLFRHSGVRPEAVRDLVYGAIFTRSAEDLRRTALFIGGSDVAASEALLDEVRRTFFGPMRVSVMMDSNGSIRPPLPPSWPPESTSRSMRRPRWSWLPPGRWVAEWWNCSLAKGPGAGGLTTTRPCSRGLRGSGREGARIASDLLCPRHPR